jgi:hypothetical protein
MATALKTKPGINGANVLSIPVNWDATWFRKFINNSLKGADVRNAIAGPGITITGNISSPYATISATGGAGGVSQIVAGAGVGVSPAGGTGVVTVSNTGVTQIVGGTGISVSPAGGTGAVTVSLSSPSPSSGLPGTIPDLTLWWESDNILVTPGSTITSLQERTPWITGVTGTQGPGTATASALTVSATTLNGRPIIQWPIPAGSGIVTLSNGGFALLNGGTFFVVCIPGAATAALQCLIGGSTNSLALYLEGVASTAHLTLIKTGAAVIASSTATWVNGTPFQANATYNPVSSAFAFRQGRAAAGSGSSGVTNAGQSKTQFIGADVGPSAPLNLTQIAALIVYNRVLTATEITNVENYLFATWGV